MKALVLLGSPRENGNTAALAEPFCQELEKNGVEAACVRLYERSILPCLGCCACQENLTDFGCVRQDDVEELTRRVLDADLLVLATPIYAWYCTPPMKALLDRLVYGMNKYYGSEKGPSLWQGKAVALLETCGYRPEKGSDLFEEGMRRYCKHSQLRYLGHHVQRHLGYDTVFMDGEKERCVREFARELLKKV